MPNVIITGGAGFIGSSLTDTLLKMGWAVTAIDNFDAYYDAALKRQNIAGALLHSQYRFIEQDIKNTSELIKELGKQYSVIIHLAAKAGVRYSITNPIGYEETNVQGTIKVCELAQKLGIPKIIFSSSSSVYGNNPELPWSEESELYPISPYAKTKVLSEQYLKFFSEIHPVKVIVFRLFSVYGPRMRPDLMMNHIYRNILNRLPVRIYGDGNSERDYTFVNDIINGILLGIDYEASNFEIMNLGNNNPVKLSKIISLFEQMLKLDARLEFAPMVEGESMFTYADISKAQRLISYKPLIDIDEGIQRFIGAKIAANNI